MAPTALRRDGRGLGSGGNLIHLKCGPASTSAIVRLLPPEWAKPRTPPVAVSSAGGEPGVMAGLQFRTLPGRSLWRRASFRACH